MPGILGMVAQGMTGKAPVQPASAAGANLSAGVAMSNVNLATSFLSASNIIIFPNKVFDIGNDYDPATGRFTVRRTGKYAITQEINVQWTASWIAGMMYSRGGVFTGLTYNANSGGGNFGYLNFLTADLIAGDILCMGASRDNSGSATINAGTNPSGFSAAFIG